MSAFLCVVRKQDLGVLPQIPQGTNPLTLSLKILIGRGQGAVPLAGVLGAAPPRSLTVNKGGNPYGLDTGCV